MMLKFIVPGFNQSSTELLSNGIGLDGARYEVYIGSTSLARAQATKGVVSSSLLLHISPVKLEDPSLPGVGSGGQGCWMSRIPLESAVWSLESVTRQAHGTHTAGTHKAYTRHCPNE